jgi:acetyltransferase-like isoleucine patch superfamily enzyme
MKYIIIILEPWRILRRIRLFIENILSLFPLFSFFRKTRSDECPVTLTHWFNQKVLGYNKLAYWPMHPSSQVSYTQKILIGKNVNPGYQFGCFIHGVNGITIGDYTSIAPNVGIMSGNHDPLDLRIQVKANPIHIGSYCWIGMNSMILANVILGDFTIVAAGAVVTKSFEEGYCIIGGNPARIIKKLDPTLCNRYEMTVSHIGYYPVNKFDNFKQVIIKNISCAE